MDRIVREWANPPGHVGWVLQEREDGWRRWQFPHPTRPFMSDWKNPDFERVDDPLVSVAATMTPTLDLTRERGEPLELAGKCRYGKPKALLRAPRKIAHEKLQEDALSAIKSWVSRNYREWPSCMWGGEVRLYVVERTLNPDEGAVWVGVFGCDKCGA